MTTFINKKSNKEGFVILFAVTLSSIILSIALGVANIALKELNFSTSAKITNDAFVAADTGAECALSYDKLVGSSFPVDGVGRATSISCASASTSVSFSGIVNNQSSYSFVIPNISSSGGSCAKVNILKDRNFTPTAVTITSTGYSIGDGTCSSTNTNRVARELKVYSVEGVPPPSVPIVSLSANPTSGTVDVVNPTLTWSATNNPTSCTASGDWSGARAVGGGTQSQGTLSQIKTYTYTLTCFNGSGGSAPANATVIVSAAPVPVLTFAAPSSANVGTTINLNWSATNSPTSCTASSTTGDWTGSPGTSGVNYSRGPLNSVRIYNYTLYCSNAGGNSTSISRNVNVLSGNPSATCSGGCTTTQVGSYRVHTFTANGTLQTTIGGNMEYLVIGGGGGGGTSENYPGNGDGGGGGGAGGYRTGTLSVSAQDYAITVGAGGAGATATSASGLKGGDSIFSTITSAGGGSGARQEGGGGSGGSGGGAGGTCYWQTLGGGSGTADQGNNGGTTLDPGPPNGDGAYCNDHRSGSGGGGAGAVGGSTSSARGGNGGAGLSSSITGSSVTRAGGGGGGYGGGENPGTAGGGGTGGGGAGGVGNGDGGIAGGNGAVNTGSGGGGAPRSSPVAPGGSGGSGIVIIRYLYP